MPDNLDSVPGGGWQDGIDTSHIDVIQNANDLNYNKSTNKYSLEKLTLYCIVLVCHFFGKLCTTEDFPKDLPFGKIVV